MSDNTEVGLSLPLPPDPFQEEQTVVILVGLIASGKVDPRRPIRMEFKLLIADCRILLFY